MMKCFGLLVFMVCQPSAEPAHTGFARFCQTYKPVRWSPKDTPATVAQVKERNARWSALCKTEKAK